MPNERLIAVVKQDCPTCQLVVPVLRDLAANGSGIEIISQDDPAFPEGVPSIIDDRTLETSFKLGVEVVPTLIRFDASGDETARVFGWNRNEWRDFLGKDELGADLPENQPGCGAKNIDPGVQEVLQARFGNLPLRSRSVDIGEYDDEIEQAFERGWTDGLPVVPPTGPRLLRMLAGTNRAPDDVIGMIPPNLAPLTVEKAAINAVMAGCKPEYFPVVIAAVETALDPMFTLHGLTCSTAPCSPIIIVNGPIARSIGMNGGFNALGQGNRANATIGRALNLIVRNIGGGRPGEIDRAGLGTPGKYTFCFAEDESDPEWEPLSVSRGIAPGKSAITLFQGDGVQGFVDQRSRTPEELTRSLAMSLAAVVHPKLCEWCNAVLVLSPEHYAIYRNAGWDRAQISKELYDALLRPGRDLVQGANGVGEGMPESCADEMLPKFHRDGLLIVRAGGPAGLFSGIMAGWIGGRNKDELQPVTREIIL